MRIQISKKCMSNFKDFTIKTHGTAKADVWEQTLWSHISTLLHTISIITRDSEAKGDIWHNRGHFLDPAVYPGCLYVWSLAVWVHIDSANTHRTHSSIQHTADLWSICDSSRTICSFFWPSLSRHTFCRNLSAPKEDKGETPEPDLSVNIELSESPLHRWLDNVNLKTFLSPCWFLLSTSSRHIPENTQEH